MGHLIKSKLFITFVIASFILFITPFVRAGEVVSTASLVGFVYAKDGTTPVEGAVFKVKNVKTHKVYKSTKTDRLGMFKIQGIEGGLYVAGVNSGDNVYNFPKQLGIKAHSTAKIAVALNDGQTVKLPKGSDQYNLFTFLGFSGNVAISVLIGLLFVVGISVVALVDALEEEVSPFK